MHVMKKDKMADVQPEPVPAPPPHPDPIPVSAQPVQPQSPASNHKRNRFLWFFSFVILILALIWLIYYLLVLQFHQYTDDAFANGSMVNLNSAVPGTVIAFYADDTALVYEGQLLVQLDATAYQVAYDKELATLGSVVLDVRQLYDNVKVAQAIADSKEILLNRAEYDFQNRSQLVASKAISNEDFIHSKDDLNIAQLSLTQAKHSLQVALDLAGNTPWEQHPQIIKQRNSVLTAYYNLHHCKIFAPATGYIAQRSVDVGEWVTTTRDMMWIIPITDVWVDANYKETELTYMRVGQEATVWFDIYGSKVIYKGKVLGIASGTGSVFSIIPPQNATGNWIKIVQRLPVRISLDPEEVKKYPTRLGISAEVDVDITNQDLPFLTSMQPERPIAVTTVFNLDLDKVNAVMDQIIKVESD
jgi:membrane fusion protein (multidrug efflux system)